MRLDAGGEHARGEGLFDVVVRTEPETADLVHVLLPRRDQQDRDVELFAQTAADLKAVEPREHEIEQNQGKFAAKSAFEPGRPVRRDLRCEAVELEIVALDGGDRLVVLNDQDFLHRKSPPLEVQ